MFPNELEARKAIVKYSHKVHAGGFVSATDGNLSVRLDENHVLITPSSLRKEDMYVEAPIVIDMNGAPVNDTRRPSTEYKVHLEAYRQRPDVRAVIHAHPPKAIAFTIAEMPLDTCILPEVVVTMGEVPVAPYATPSTEALPASMSELIRRTDALMLARHGSVTVGPDLGDAFKKLEKLEHNAEILIYTRILGGAKPFSGAQLEELRGLRDFYGVKTQAIACATPNYRGATPIAPATTGPHGTGRADEEQAPTYRGGEVSMSEDQLEELVNEIVARVRRRL